MRDHPPAARRGGLGHAGMLPRYYLLELRYGAGTDLVTLATNVMNWTRIN